MLHGVHPHPVSLHPAIARFSNATSHAMQPGMTAWVVTGVGLGL
ncbi:hypothetical protein [Novosphingobium sp. UBA6272]|nr:hypothetical protein [Novosphingobium sp. UBA6272]HQV04482.1 hypothetical protein [Novosphingobium sp.]